MKSKIKKRREIEKRTIHAPEVLCEATEYPDPVPFSRGVRVSMGEFTFIFISGTASVDHRGKTVHRGDIFAQARRTFDNITALLKSEGARWKDVIKTTIFLKSMRYYKSFNLVRAGYYEEQGLKELPASTCVEARLCRDDLLVEIEAIALIKKRAPR